MTDREWDYLAYLLRLWRAGTGEGGGWRASLQDPYTGERIGFACLDDAVAYLRERMGEGDAGADDGAGGPCARHDPG
jgi:hypothetical protein